jgi:hypothetical protein
MEIRLRKLRITFLITKLTEGHFRGGRGDETFSRLQIIAVRRAGDANQGLVTSTSTTSTSQTRSHTVSDIKVFKRHKPSPHDAAPPLDPARWE